MGSSFGKILNQSAASSYFFFASYKFPYLKKTLPSSFEAYPFSILSASEKSHLFFSFSLKLRRVISKIKVAFAGIYP